MKPHIIAGVICTWDTLGLSSMTMTQSKGRVDPSPNITHMVVTIKLYFCLVTPNDSDRFKKKTTHFDSAVRTNKTVYKTTFKFHSLHFLLTDALRLLKLKQPNCHTTYRRSKSAFEGKVNQIIRFGYFASKASHKTRSTHSLLCSLSTHSLLCSLSTHSLLCSLSPLFTLYSLSVHSLLTLSSVHSLLILSSVHSLLTLSSLMVVINKIHNKFSQWTTNNRCCMLLCTTIMAIDYHVFSAK
uniref:NAD(P)(+)--arginine ADP-ribosyltransferase n=1 Tax=Esox lucius TaxID=8010 RepID=A0AAY5KPV3_ESOLU